ncbi:MAG: HD domain-containing phosphohydrolase [Bdellovibrionota bacterium]
MEPILLDYHAHIDKFLGDGIMAEFGAPIDHEHYRLLAVLSGLEMQDKMRTINLPWEIKIGIASGSAITGLIGSQRQSYTSIGDVVNIASRLENQCPPGEIIIDEYTYEGVKRFINTCNYQLTTQEYKKEQTIRDQVDQLTQELLKTETIPIRATILKELSELYMQIAEEDLAYQALQNAIALQPNEPMYKLAMADMVISKEQKRTIKVKGRKKSLKAFKVIGIKDSLNDPNKIPPKLYKKFKPMLQSIEIPQRFSLKVEAIDGSIGHSNAVALLAYAMASKLNVYDKENIDILIAGFAADFGKEIISHHILNRKGNLSNNEILEVQKHPVESIRILKSMGYKSDNIFSIIRHSHERINGGGYPNGLKGEQIPLGSRIIAVADAYDALTSWRPYREKWDRAAALDEIKKSVIRGWYDPIVVNALIDLFNENLPESEIPINKLAG